MRNEPVAPAVTEDRLLDGRVTLRQPAAGYRVAIDPVLLAAAVPARAGERVLDLGAGVGAAMLCLAWRVPECRVVGLELQPDLVTLAEANIRANDRVGRATILAGDLTDADARRDCSVPGGFDHVMANPPHLAPGRGAAPPDPAKALAHVEGAGDLDVWLDFCLARLRPEGWVTMIHRADRLDALLAGLHGRAGAIVVFPLWPRAGVAAKRVIVRARKGVATPARLAAGLVLHMADGTYTPATEAVLRAGRALAL